MAKKKKKKGFISGKGDKQKQKVAESKIEKPLRAFWFSPPRDEIVGLACFFGVVVLSFMMSFHTLVDTDIFWQLKSGEIIFKSHRVPDRDIYSFTVSGSEWIDSQWFFQLLIYIFYRTGGYFGMTLLGALLMAFCWALIFGAGYERSRYFRVIPLVLVSLLASSSRLRLRPEILTFTFLSIELFLLQLYRRGKRWTIYPIPVLIWLWANSHGLWPMGIFILAVMLIEQVLYLPGLKLERHLKPGFSPLGRKGVKELGICLVVSMILIWFNPYGFRGIIFPLRLLWEISSKESFIGKFIGEFQSPFILDNPVVRPAYIILVCFSGMLFVLSFLMKKFPVAELIICGAFFYISSTANRNVPLFAIVVAMLGGELIQGIKAGEGSWFKHLLNLVMRFRAIFALVLIIGMILTGREIVRNRFYIWDRLYCQFGPGVLDIDYPVRASEFLKSISELNIGRSLRIFVDIHNSGYLIWAGYPDWRVYVDPRMEVYKDEFIKRYSELFNNWEKFSEEDRRYDFDLVFVSAYRIGSGFVQNLARSARWVLIYLDGKNVIFVKNEARFSRVIERYQMDLRNGLNTALPKKGVDGFWMGKERYNRGIVLLWLNYREQAVYEFKEGLKFLPGDANLTYQLGITLSELRRYEEALPYLEKNAREYPDDILGHIHLARALSYTGESERAVMILQGLLNRYPFEIGVCMELARVYERMEQKERAYSQWQRCYKIFQMDQMKYKRQGFQIMEALKRYKGGAEEFR